MKPNWAAILGDVDLSNNEIALLPALNSQGVTSNIPQALVRSNLEFEQGRIAMEVRLADPDAKCHIGLNIDQGGELYAGINTLGALYGFALQRNGRWKPLAGSGHGADLAPDQWYKLALSVRGSNLELSLDDVKVAEAAQQIQKGPVNLMLQGSGRVTIRNLSIESRPSECFIVMQFTEEYNALYREVIRPTC